MFMCIWKTHMMCMNVCMHMEALRKNILRSYQCHFYVIGIIAVWYGSFTPLHFLMFLWFLFLIRVNNIQNSISEALYISAFQYLPQLGTYTWLFFFTDFIYLFSEKGREKERERNVSVWLVASRVPPPGDLAHNPGMCSDWKSNRRPFGSQAGAQSTEPHQPGLYLVLREN